MAIARSNRPHGIAARIIASISDVGGIDGVTFPPVAVVSARGFAEGSLSSDSSSRWADEEQTAAMCGSTGAERRACPLAPGVGPAAPWFPVLLSDVVAVEAAATGSSLAS